MSGHMMSTMNPEAIAEMDAASLPQVGDTVIFVPRPGEGRRGRQQFPAIVMAHNDARGRTGLDLLVIYDARDVIDLDSVQISDENYNSFCWKPREQTAAPVAPDYDDLRRDLDTLRQDIYGAYEKPPKSLMDYLVDFEARVKAAEAATGKAPKKAK
jgi:hypothetical protein